MKISGGSSNVVLWFPGYEEQKFMGRLTVTENSLLLSIEEFVEQGKIPFSNWDDVGVEDVIWGYHMLEQEPFTLFDCYQERFRINPTMLHGTYDFQVDYMLLGIHVKRPELLNVSRMLATSENLFEWADIRGAYLKLPTSDDSEKEGSISYELPAIDSEVFYVDAIQAKLKLELGVETKKPSPAELEFRRELLISLTTDHQQNFRLFIKNFEKIFRLITLLTGKPCYISKLYVQHPSSRKPLMLVFRRNELTKKSGKMFSSFSDVKDNFESILNRWFTRSDILKDAHDLYLSVLYNPSLYLNNEFLNYVQSIETFHREICEGKYLTDDDYEIHKDQIVSAIPSELEHSFRQSLKSRIYYGNEYSLRKRIKEFLEYINEGSVDDILGLSGAQGFINKIVDTRNYLTHYTDELREKSIPSYLLFRENLKMKMLLATAFFQDLGVESSKFNRIVKHLSYNITAIRDDYFELQRDSLFVLFFKNDWYVLRFLSKTAKRREGDLLTYHLYECKNIETDSGASLQIERLNLESRSRIAVLNNVEGKMVIKEYKYKIIGVKSVKKDAIALSKDVGKANMIKSLFICTREGYVQRRQSLL